MHLYFLRHFRALLYVVVFLTTILVLSPGNLFIKSSAQKHLAGTITGRVFQDFNANGLFDTSGGTSAQPAAVDVGVAGVTVSAFDLNGNIQGSAVTASNGTYTLAAGGAGPYRVEFSTLPSGFRPSARSKNSVGGGSTTNAGSTVQFVADGNTSNVNLAVNRPGDYCQDNPDICSQLYGVGAATQPDAVFTVPYWAGSTRTTGGTPVTDFQDPGNTNLATTDDVGTTFGIASHRGSRRIFVAAYMKKHTKFGPGGPGAIYQIDRTSGTVSEYVNLNTIFGPTTAGTDPHNPLDYNTDNGQATWNAVGKIAFGGMALSDDEEYLFVMNLANRRLYRIPTSGTLDSSTITSTAFPSTMPDCTTSGNVRPFAVSWYEGMIYVGAVCSMESSILTISANLRAYVWRFDPNTMSFEGTPVMNFQLNYTRLETDPGYGAAWRNWRSTYQTISNSHFIYPQPMLTDIEFDRRNLILSFRDRNGDQSGYNSASNPNNPSQLFKGITAGDILRACWNGSAWVLESNGRCGGIGNAPQNTNEGPGNGEYYYQDNYHPNGNPHDEVGLGGAAQIPGHNVLVATVFDPVYIPNNNVYDAGGFRWFVNGTGAQNRGYLAYWMSDFGKANGIGNVEPLCEAAPIEIGNRVWRDSNANGVQDPGEDPIPGVTVHLYEGSVLVGTAVTNTAGEYYFVSGSGIDVDPSDNIGIVDGGVKFNTAYQVRFDHITDYHLGGPLFGMVLTAANTSTQAGETDSSDSDASYVFNPSGSPPGIFPVISLTTGSHGANDHTFDAGFVFGPSAANVSVEGRVTTMTGNGIRNVRVFIDDGTGRFRQALTGPFGYYRFDDVEAGRTYFVSVEAKRFVFKQNTRVINATEDLFDIDFVAEN